MAKIINISDKLSNEKPKLLIGDVEYTINNGMSTMLKFEECLSKQDISSMVKAVELVIGEEEAKQIGINEMTFEDFKVIVIAITAAMQNVDYEEAEKRFRTTLLK